MSLERMICSCELIINVWQDLAKAETETLKREH